MKSPSSPSIRDSSIAFHIARVAQEAGAELVGGVRVELTEDDAGLPPGLHGRVGVAGGAVRLAELGEDAGLAVAVAELPEQVEGLPVAVDGLGSVAEVLVGVAKA